MTKKEMNRKDKADLPFNELPLLPPAKELMWLVEL